MTKAQDMDWSAQLMLDGVRTVAEKIDPADGFEFITDVWPRLMPMAKSTIEIEYNAGCEDIDRSRNGEEDVSRDDEAVERQAKRMLRSILAKLPVLAKGKKLLFDEIRNHLLKAYENGEKDERDRRY